MVLVPIIQAEQVADILEMAEAMAAKVAGVLDRELINIVQVAVVQVDILEPEDEEAAKVFLTQADLMHS
jgi:hypothetical protein